MDLYHLRQGLHVIASSWDYHGGAESRVSVRGNSGCFIIYLPYIFSSLFLCRHDFLHEKTFFLSLLFLKVYLSLIITLMQHQRFANIAGTGRWRAAASTTAARRAESALDPPKQWEDEFGGRWQGKQVEPQVDAIP
jgi:hypothetical protein